MASDNTDGLGDVNSFGNDEKDEGNRQSEQNNGANGQCSQNNLSDQTDKQANGSAEGGVEKTNDQSSDDGNSKKENPEPDNLDEVVLKNNSAKPVKKSEDEDDDEDDADDDNVLKYDPTPTDRPYPMPDWYSVAQLQRREYGYLLKPGHKRPYSSVFNSHSFCRYAYNSLFFFQRMELMGKLEEHHGCVNCLNFNNSGDLICSGSDDLRIIVWDWQKSQLKTNYHSGHTSNVFQCRWCLDGNHIVSCARDGQVRICNLNRGNTITSNKLAQHKGPAHKLVMTAPQVILSCGEDALVMEIDLRMDKPSKLLFVKNQSDRKVPLYSIHASLAFNPFQFVVSGRDPYTRIYDRRFLPNVDSTVTPIKSLCPEHLTQSKHSVTCAQFNSTADIVLATYNDEDIYTFNTKTGAVENFYQGHRNNATVKGCSWFGDDFIVSGSDDGYIYGWEKSTQHIVMSLYADENGVVNCIEPHPTAPIIASSGLDNNVKVWVPSANEWPQTLKGIKQRICTNMRDRKLEQKRYAGLEEYEDSIDASMLYMIIRHMRRQRARAERSRRAANETERMDDDHDEDDDDLDGEDDDSDDNEQSNFQQCIQS